MNFKNQFFNLLFICCAISLVVSCSDDDDDSIPQNNTSLFEAVLTEMGGKDNINNVTSLQYESTGIAYEFQEDPEPVGGKVADYTYTLTHSGDGAKSEQAWHLMTDYAYESDLTFTETLDGTNGKTDGAASGFFSEHFGFPGDPMFSTKLAARRKSIVMSSPITLMQMIDAATEVNGSEVGTISTNYNASGLGYGTDAPDIEFIINTTTNIPTKAQAWENDPLYGDVLYEVLYDEWTEVDGLKLPNKITHVLNGNTIREETLTNIVLNTAISISVNSTEAYPYSASEAEAGYVSSQFHFRTQMQTFPIDFPVEIVDATQGVPSSTLEFDNTVLRVAGDFQSHYTYAFDMGDNILLYDAPINNRRSAVVLDKVRESFGNKTISNVILSHNHFDHTGGWRGCLAEGGDLVVGMGSKTFMEGLLTNTHDILSNPIAGQTVNVVGLADMMTFGEGDTRIEAHIIENTHAVNEDYLILYQPANKAIYYNDIYNPGFYPTAFDNTTHDNRVRMIELAQELVAFVDAKGWDIERSICTHGFPTDSDFANVRALALETP